MTRYPEFIRNGRAYCIQSIADSRVAPPGFERVPSEEAAWLVARWAYDPDPLENALRPHDALVPFGHVPNHAHGAWLTERLRERLTTHAADLVLFQRIMPSPALEFEIDVIDLSDFLPEPPRTDTQHWIEFILLDGDEKPIENMPCEVELTDGRTRKVRTDRFGLIRFDGLTRAGNCTIRVPSAEIEDDDDEVETFAEFVLVDEDENPIADTKCVIEAPDGTRHECTTDANGTVRVDGIPESGEYTLEFE